MDVDLLSIFAITVVALMVPGPATLLIIGTALSEGRRMALAAASGVVTGSLIWSGLAALGMGAVMLANAWVLEAVRVAGGLYLLYLAYRSARSALRRQAPTPVAGGGRSLEAGYWRGLGQHLSNPKPILFFGSLFALAVPPGASAQTLLAVMATVAAPTIAFFLGCAIAFSRRGVVRHYERARRWIEGTFALIFGAIGLRVLFARAPA